jgi:mono/diheme cytochrome c family protein
MRHHTFLYSATGLCLAILAWSVCARAQDSADRPAATRAAATDPASQPAPAADLVDLNPGPIVQFEETCARCHGPQGSFYGEEFGHLGPVALEAMVRQMMEGPAGLSPTRNEVTAMVVYHKALHAASPFVVITNAEAFAAGRDRGLRGEATPETTVEIRRGDQVIRAKADNLVWTVPAAPRPPFTVVGSRGDRRMVVEFPRQQWSTPPAAAKSR